MISHLRLASTNPHYKPPAAVKQRAPAITSRIDRTKQMQMELRGLGRPIQGSIGELMIGDMPQHIGGRGHLEGTCMAKREGLLETKKHRKGGNHSDEDDDDCYESEEDEEEAKVWKPSQAQNDDVDSVIGSLNKEGIDWSHNSVMGKKSHVNFQTWVDEIAKRLHDQQVGTEDSLFTHF